MKCKNCGQPEKNLDLGDIDEVGGALEPGGFYPIGLWNSSTDPTKDHCLHLSIDEARRLADWLIESAEYLEDLED